MFSLCATSGGAGAVACLGPEVFLYFKELLLFFFLCVYRYFYLCVFLYPTYSVRGGQGRVLGTLETECQMFANQHVVAGN